MNLNRRNFLFGSAAAAALAGCATTKKGVRTLKDGEKPTVAIIGYGLRARDLMREFLDLTDMCRVTAVCDCDKVRLAAGVERVKEFYAKKGIANECTAYADFRDVIKNPDIDMVCIATPDHWHAYMSVEAMKAGKDVYCEKPLTFNVDESRKVMAAQKKYDRVFQTGSMQRCWPEFRTAVMIVRNGFIGDVKYVDANYGRGGQKLGGPSHPVRFFDEPEKAAIEGAPNADVDWNMWLGPAKWRPYSDRLAPRGMHKSYSQVMFWRFDDDIGTGYNGDWGAHHLDIAQWGLDMDQSGPYKIIRSDEPHSDNLFHGCRRQFGMKMLFKKPYGDVELYHGPFGTWGTVARIDKNLLNRKYAIINQLQKDLHEHYVDYELKFSRDLFDQEKYLSILSTMFAILSIVNEAIENGLVNMPEGSHMIPSIDGDFEKGQALDIANRFNDPELIFEGIMCFIDKKRDLGSCEEVLKVIKEKCKID